MADHSSSRRRRSPESSAGSRRKERGSRRAPSEIVYDEPQRMRPGPSSIPVERGANTNIAYGAETTYLSSSSSSNSSYEFIDISRTYPSNRSGIIPFFTTPSEHRARKLRRRRSNRMFRLNNSSSSSVNSDLAYGTGYLKRPKRRGVRSRRGQQIDRESTRWSDRERTRYSDSGRHSGSERRGHLSGSERRGNGSGSERRGNTEAEILAVGAGLAALAREQNRQDLRNRNGRSPQVGAMGTVGAVGHHNGADAGSRGLGPSRISHGSDTVDDDGWESASDAESENSVDSKLAFGAEASGWWGKEIHRPMSRKNTIVDPRLFGPENSLHGYVDQPVGFGEVTWTSTDDFGQQYREHSVSYGPNESVSGSQASLQQVFPIQSSRDPTRFDAARNSVASGSEPYMSTRPGPAPLQHPQPQRTPVSQQLIEPSYSNVSETTGILKKDKSSSGKGSSVAQAALAGVGIAAAGAMIVSSRSDDRKEMRRDDERDDVSRVSSSRRRDDDRDDSSRVTLKRRDSDKKESKEERRKDKRESPDRDDRKEKRREKERRKDGSRYSDEERREKKREKRREEGRDEGRDERREKRHEKRHERRDERRTEHSEVATRPEIQYDDRRSKSEAAVSTVSKVDPFMFQVDNDAFPTPTTESPEGHRRHDSVPQVVTVERVPDFSRKRSSSIKDQTPTDYDKSVSNFDERDQQYDDHGLHDAEAAFKDASFSTAAVPIAAIGVASAVVANEIYRESRSEKRRSERRSAQSSEYDDREYNSRGRDPIKERDPIQEEADRAYREIVMARKIASQVIRSRSNSPDRSVVGRYSRTEEPEVVRIVTPPEMDRAKIKGPYDAPDADFLPDHHFDDPRQLATFRPRTPIIIQGTRDPDADRSRPLLNLVRPTPVPSPLPEKQEVRSEPSRSDSKRSEPSSSERDQPETPRSESSRSKPDRSDSTRSESARPPKSRDRVEKHRTAVSEVGRGSGVASPTASTISKGVTWGENETKHFDVESPSDHREEYISSSDVPTYEPAPRPRPESKPDSKPSKGWGAIAAIVGAAGVGAAAGSSIDSSFPKTSKSKDKEREKSPPKSYEYRGIVVEPESAPSKNRGQSPPSPGSKPVAQSGHMPGAFEDDLEFTANVAAGLKDAGFNSDIVIEDPNFRRRTSPPGSNERVYQAPFAETVSDLGRIPVNDSNSSGSGFVMGEVATTPQEWRSISPEGDEFPVKLSKKEQKKRDKERRQSGEIAPSEETMPAPKEDEQDFYFNEPKLSKKEQKKRDKEAKRQSLSEEVTPLSELVVTRDVVAEPENYYDTPKKKKKSKRDSAAYDDDADTASPGGSSVSRRVSVPVDAYNDLQNDNEWSELKKSKSKSKRDSERFDSPTRSVAGSEVSGRSSSRKKERPRSYDDEEPDPTTFSLPPSTPSETSQDRDYDEIRKPRESSSRDSGIFDIRDRDASRSVVSERYDDEPRKKKKSSKSSRDRDDFDDSRSVVSVASAPAGDEDSRKSKKKDKEKKGGGFFSLFGSKSEVGARDESPKKAKDDFDDVKSKKKKKRSSMPDTSSLYGDLASQSVGDLSRSTSNGHSSRRYDDDEEARSDGERKKTRSRGDSASSRKESFLDNPGTLGARVGLLAGGAAAVIATHQLTQAKADEAHDRALHQDQSDRTERRLDEDFDPEITQRDFRPSIDPQYGDLLPLPPSEPPTPGSEEFEELPGLPESRPDTPEEERIARERMKSSTRKHLHETPAKSPSHSAIPINFRMGKGKVSAPSSPGLPRATPLQSPAAPSTESLTFPRQAGKRPTSWESSRDYRPLYLPESVRRGSTVQVKDEPTLPELPPSETASRSSSELDFVDARTGQEEFDDLPSRSEDHFYEPLSIDTGLATHDHVGGLLDSQQSTPKANISFHDEHKDAISQQDHKRELAAAAIVSAALAGTTGFLALDHDKTETDLLPLEGRPSPIDPMSKDRSSYLLRSSPSSKKDDSPIDSINQSPTTRSECLREASRERTLETLISGKTSPDGDLEDFPSFKSKKNKKKEKKKGKAIGWEVDESETSTPATENSAPETSRDLAAALPSVPADNEAVYSFYTPSKKGKKDKKAKGKSKIDWEPQPDAESLELAPEKPSSNGQDSPNLDTSEDFIPMSSKKGKKDKKGRAKVFSDLEAEEVLNEPFDNVESQAIQENQVTFEAVQSTFISKKDKKDKKKGQGTSMSFEELGNDDSEPILAPLAEASTPADEPVNDFFTPKSKKDKKGKKKGKTATSSWEPEPDNAFAGPDLQPDIESETAREFFGFVQGEADPEDRSADLPIFRDLPAPDTAAERSFDASQEEVPAPDHFAIQDSKKGKKKKGKGTTTWELEEAALVDPIPPVKSPAEFSIAGSKKGKKKGKKSQSSNADEPFSHEAATEQAETCYPSLDPSPLEAATAESKDIAFEDLTTLISKKGKKKGKKGNMQWDESEPVTLSHDIATPQIISSNPTPMVGPGGWLETPVSPSEIKDDSIEAQSKDSRSNDYFSSAVLPGAAIIAGAALLASNDWEKDGTTKLKDPQQSTPDGLSAGYKDDQLSLAKQLQEEFAKKSSKKDKKKRQSLPATPDLENSRSRDADDLEAQPRARSLSNGPPDSDMPKSLYSEDQLELARQLKADFEKGSSKKSKKGKKRQDTSTWDDSPRDQPSEEPVFNETEALDTTSSLDAPVHNPKGDGFAAGYQEDQLELARQLKAEFEKGNSKISKKDKKKRQDTSAWDERTPEQPTEDAAGRDVDTTQDLPTTDAAEDPSKGDGFAAGYQEDQLSLARQLQAEFSKKSKKDKKLRSTSQTPQGEEPANDYFGVVEPSWDQPQNEDAPLQESNNESEFTRDGLAAGYKEDQLELARQLKAEYGSGSSKRGKKDKKGGKCDTLESSAPGAPQSVNEDFAQSDPTESPAVADSDEDFTYLTKKSKKDKKGKKREKLVQSATDDILPMELQDPIDVDLLQTSLGEEKAEETPTVTPEDDYVFSKLSKKDKKAKTLESLAKSTSGDIIPTPDSEAPRDIMASKLTKDFIAEQINDAVATQTRDNSPEISSKKSKRDKKSKKGKSALDPTEDSSPSFLAVDNDGMTGTPTEEAPPMFESRASESITDFSLSKNPKGKKGKSTYDYFDDVPIPASESEIVPITGTVPAEDKDLSFETTAEPTDDFEFSTKKSKKDKKGKKRDSSVPATVEYQSSMSDLPAVDLSDKGTHLDDNAPLVPSEPQTVFPEEEFSLPGKKSKKGKKKRQSIVVEGDIAPEHPSEQQIIPTSIDEPLPASITEGADDNSDNFGFSLKKSKDKKRGSLLRHSSTYDDFSEDETLISDEKNLADESTVEPDDGFMGTSKTSKDKKMRLSMQEFSTPDPSTPEIEEPPVQQKIDDSEKTTRDIDASLPEPPSTLDMPPADHNVEPQQDTPMDPAEGSFDDFAPIKKSKKGIKKNKSSKFDAEDIAPNIEENTKSSLEDPSLLTEDDPRDLSECTKPRPSTTALDAEGTGVWDSFSSGKKSKKDKKKKKDLQSEPREPSRISTSSLATDEAIINIEPESPAIVDNSESTEERRGLNLGSDMPATKDEELQQSEWSLFSVHPSKRDKKKDKSGLSTPIEKAVQPETPADATTPLGEDVQAAEEPAQDEWFVPTRSSKKDKKKNRKSALSTPDEEFAQPEMPIDSEAPIDGDVQAIEELSQDVWSAPTKTSKKDKKKNRKSGLSTPVERPPEQDLQMNELESIEKTPILTSGNVDVAADTLVVVSALPEVTRTDSIEDQWVMPPKKSKKDKNKRMSEILGPVANTSEHYKIGDNSQAADKAFPADAVTSKGLVEEPSQIDESIHEPADAEWGFSTKKSKKDKKRKSGLSTPVEDMPDSGKAFDEPHLDTEKPVALDLGDESKEPAQEVVDSEWGSISTKKSKKDKRRKSGVSTPVNEIPMSIEQISEPPPTLSTQDPAPDPVADEWAMPSKRSKKDKKRKSGLSTPTETASEQLGAFEQEPTSIEDNRGLREEILMPEALDENLADTLLQDPASKPVKDEWAMPTKKSKKDKKKEHKPGLSTSIESAPEQSNSIEQQSASLENHAGSLGEQTQPPSPLDESLATTPLQDLASEPVDEEWAMPGKKSKKDKKKDRKSGQSFPLDDPIENPASAGGHFDQENAPIAKDLLEIPQNTEEILAPAIEDSAQEPANDDWVATPFKKSKKDKKKSKSGLSTPMEEPLEILSTTPAVEQDVPATASKELAEKPLMSLQEQVDNEWDSFSTTKKSKKDKKKNTSGLSTPKDESSEIFNNIPPALKQDVPATTSKDLVKDLMPLQEQAENEWDSFSTAKKSKDKKKNKPGLSTSKDEEPEPLSATQPVQDNLPTTTVVDDDATQPIEISDASIEGEWKSFSADKKKSKKEKKNRKSGISTPVEAEPMPAADKSTERAIIEDSSKTEEASIASAQSDSINDPVQEWATLPSKKSKKDRKKCQSGLSTPIDEPSSFVTPPEAIESSKASEDVVTTPEEEILRDLSDIHNTAKKQTSLDFTEETDHSSLVKDIDVSAAAAAIVTGIARHDATAPSNDIPEKVDGPVSEWDTRKQSKKDKQKRKSGITTPMKDTIEDTTQGESFAKDGVVALSEEVSVDPIVKHVEEPMSLPEESQQPEVDWVSTNKKSKKDKKKTKNFTGSFENIEELSTASLSEDRSISSPRELVETALTLTAPRDQSADEWDEFSTKKSKKDKKGKGKPKEFVEEPEKSYATPPPQNTEQSLDIQDDIVRKEPVQNNDEEWGSVLNKKPKKDKKGKGKSKDTFEEFESSYANPPAQDDLDIAREQEVSVSQEKLQEAEGEWDSAPTKKSKKDKKNKGKGKSSTGDLETPIIPDPEPVNTPMEIVSEPPAVEEMLKDLPDDIVQEPEGEWDSAPTKKSKKDKKNKGKGKSSTGDLETPIIPDPEPVNTPMEIVSEPPVVEEMLKDLPDDIVQEPEGEWDSAPTKKSKKDKKNKGKGKSSTGDLETPIIPDPEPVNTPMEIVSEPPAVEEMLKDLPDDTVQEPEGEWDSAPTKKSKKDKKNKGKGKSSTGDLETPIIPDPEPVNTPMEIVSEPPAVEEMPKDLPDDIVQEPEGEWDSAPTKKSKKDKKNKGKGKSVTENFLTPVVPISEPAIIPAEIVSEPVAAVEEIPKEFPNDITREAEAEWGTTVTKKSKKDKKKRKSGLLTPTEEPLPIVEPESQRSILDTTNESDPQTLVSEPLEIESSRLNIASKEELSQEPAEDFAFVSKKSKKDKEGKEGHHVDSITEVESSTPRTMTPALETESTPVVTEIATDDVTSVPVVEPVVAEDIDISSGSLSRKSSKKDKRKRQATVDANMVDDAGTTSTPVTSWAEEVEEAEVERTIPVIDDIACDESLSHIPTTIEATMEDDFVRPNKKGKKSKKSKSMDNSRAPISYDSSKKDDTILPAVAAAGAIVAGAAILGESSKSSGSSSPKGKEKAKEPEIVQPPTRKLSKKEKKKMSIDKRTPTNDIFDDDALWEGKDPKEFDERNAEFNDDVDDDGFWSPPQQEFSFQTAETSFQEPNLSRDSSMQHTDVTASRQPIVPHDRPLSPPDDMEFSRTLDQETPSTSSSRDIPFEQESPSAFADPQSTDRDMIIEESSSDRNPFRNSKFGRSGFSDLPILEEEPTDFHHEEYPKPTRHSSDDPNRDSAFVTESPVPVQGPFAAHHENIRDSGVHLRDASPGVATRAPVSTSDAAISRLSWPSVDEETETVDLTKQQKTQDKKKASRSHRGQELYRPLEEANRSFEVYQTKEKSNRSNELYIPKDESSKNHHEESTTRDFLPSQKASGEQHSDLHRTSTIHRHGDDKPHSQYEEKRSIINVSEPHHSSTTSKHEWDRQHQKDEEKRSNIDALPSQRGREDPHADLHRSQTIHRSGGDRPSSHHEDKTASKNITPPKLRAIDTSTVLTPTETSRKSAEESIVKKRLQRFESPELQQSPKFGGSVKERVQRLQSPELRAIPRSVKQEIEPSRVEQHQSPEIRTPSRVSKKESYSELSHLRNPKAEQPRSVSDNTNTNTIAAGAAIVGAAGLGFAAARQLSQEKRPGSASSIRSVSNINRLRTPNRPESVNSNRSGTPPLRRSDRKVSGDLRSLSQRSQVDLGKEAELAALTSTAVSATVNATGTPVNPTANEGRVRAKEMADVYDGFGEGRIGSPRSPTRPHSMRRRQSMQVLDLESRVEQLAAENRMLAEAKSQAERTLQTSTTASSSLVEKDAEIDALKRTLDWLQNEVSRLTEVNDGLTSANITLGNQQNERYGILEAQHAQTSRELQEARDAHTHVSSGMEAVVVSQVAAQVAAAVQGKDQEIAQLRAELEATKAKIRTMQAQILMAKTNDIDFLTVRDEDYFDNACQQLCQHVQQWVLRFSKFSDMRACRLTSEINNDKTIDRLDNAILDGSDVDSYLTDRVKRRDVFMSMTMTMVWEFTFTRYLFGMDREQRQKLKSLEKLLSEVGPAAAVHQWRATTLTLLSKREAFVNQREQDTQAVVHAVMETLSEILPPPSHLEDQIEAQLKRVMKSAVDLSIEMRTQRAEYMMLPPLQPEYDANGDLASKVSFNAALMNERSGDTISNEDLENQMAVVRVVLFPLVVKKGDDRGEGDEEIVVCPAQVLVAKPKKSVRMMSPGKNLSRASMQSSMPADYNEERDEEDV